MSVIVQPWKFITPPPVYTYATWDAVNIGAGIILSNGNLTAYIPSNPPAGGTGATARSSIGKSSGKWYWELTVTSGQLYGALRPLAYFGMANASHSLDGNNGRLGVDSNSFGVYEFDGSLDYAAGNTAFGTFWNIGDVIGMAFDATAATTQLFKNNVSMGTITNSNANIGSGLRYAAISCWPTHYVTITANFGATTLTYTPPAGFNAGLYV